MRLAVVLYLFISFNQFYEGQLIDNKPNGRNDVVYVSRYRGKAKSDSCGSESLPCKALQAGVDKLPWGGKLFVDGKQTEKYPYTCESAGKLVVNKSIAIQWYTTTVHISCINGFTLTGDGPNAGMNITIIGVHFNNTSLFLKDTSAAFRNCSFTSSEPAITVKISKDASSLYSLDIQNAVFTRNLGCIQINVKEGSSCNSIIMKLRDTIFQNNTTPVKSGKEATGIIFVRNKNCCCQEMSLFSVWKNVTTLHNQGSSSDENNSEQDHNDKENFREELTGKSTKSVLAVDACRVNLTFTEVTSESNKNMRFLTLQSQDNFIRIEDSRYYGHHIDKPGGVLLIKGNGAIRKRTLLRISSSYFYDNSGTLGGVFQIDGGKETNVDLRMKDVRLYNSYGSVYGCAVCVGDVHRSNVPMPSVARISAMFDSLEVEKCHDPSPCMRNSCKLYPAFCLRASETAEITIKNSRFKHNKYQALLIEHTSGGPSKDKILDVHISNTSFINNSFSAGIQPTVKVIVSVPNRMQKSILNVSKSAFLWSKGIAIYAKGVEEVYIKDFTCKGTSQVCLDVRPSKKRKQSPINSTFDLENCQFIENCLPLKFTSIKPSFLNISIKNTTFHKNFYCKKHPIVVGQMGITNTLISGSILMDRVSFTSNNVQHVHGSILGVVVAPNSGRFNVEIRNSLFKDNSHKYKKNNTAFVNLFYFYIPHTSSEKKSVYASGKPNDTCPMYVYRNKITFENVTFSNNTAITSILFVKSGIVSFYRCLFKDNFSFQPNIGAHLYFEKGATSGRFYHSKFIQTMKSPYIYLNDSSLPPLLYFGAQGPVTMSNTSFQYDLFIFVTVPIFVLESGHDVDLDNETTFVCPVGSFLKIYNATFILKPEYNDHNCVLTIIRLRFRCRTCPVNTYTLEGGSFRGTQKDKSFVPCFHCPFGAQCTNNIQSKPNFWGYKTQENPPKLKFEKCPDGYCKPAPSSNFSIYNKCAGNRNGTMCGACKERFTESMFNHKCRRMDDCQDHWFWLIAALYSVLMAIFVLCQSSLMLFLIKKALWFRAEKDTIPNSRVEQMKTKHNHDGHAYFKIIFYFYQVTELLMLESCSEILPNFPLLSSIISFYNFHIELADSSFGCPFPGLTAVTKELFLCSQVYAVMIIIVLFYLLHWLFSLIRKSPRPHFAHYLAAIIEVLLLGYERLGHTSLMLLNCTPLKMLGKIEWRLVLDGNITCWVHWWQYVMIAYNIVFVIPFLLVLLVGTSKLKRQKISALQFVAACFVPLPFLMYWLLRRCLRCDKDLEESIPCGDQEGQNALLEILQGPFRPPDNQSKGALYWESILIGRRLVLLCLFSFIATLLPRLLCMTLVCMLILIHNVIAMPYKDRKANLFAVVLLSTHVAMATINLSESVLITAGVAFEGPLKTQIDGFKMLEIFLLSALPCAFALLVAAVVLSQTVRLILIVSRYLLNGLDVSSRRASYQPLLNPGENITTYLN